jgi:hypothetical protein
MCLAFAAIVAIVIGVSWGTGPGEKDGCIPNNYDAVRQQVSTASETYHLDFIVQRMVFPSAIYTRRNTS